MSHSENGMPNIKPTRSLSYEKPLPTPNEARGVQRKNVSQNSGTYEEIQGLRMDLEREHEERLAIEEELVRVQSELNRAVVALGSIHATDRFRVDDEQITKLVKELRYDIKTWSQNFPPGKAQKKNLSALFPQIQQDGPFRDVVSNPKIYLNSDSGHDLRALIQGYAWHILLRDVFGNWLWVAGPCSRRSSDKLCKLFDVFNGLDKYLLNDTPDDEDYYHWRAQTSRLVEPIAHKSCIEEAIKVVVKDVKQELKSLVLADNKDIFFDRRDDQARTTTFESVVRSAVTLDKIMCHQKAHFSFFDCYGRYTPSGFNPVSMEADMENCVEEETTTQTGQYQPARQIQLTKAPAFLKAGTSEGKEYDLRVVLLRAVVDITQPIEPSLSRQTSTRG